MLRLPYWLVLPGTIALFAVIVNFAGAPSTFLIVVGADPRRGAVHARGARRRARTSAAAWIT